MPHPLIDKYHNSLAKAVQYGKSASEEAIKSYCWILLIDLLKRVCTVSVRTQSVIERMKSAHQ